MREKLNYEEFKHRKRSDRRKTKIIWTRKKKKTMEGRKLSIKVEKANSYESRITNIWTQKSGSMWKTRKRNKEKFLEKYLIFWGVSSMQQIKRAKFKTNI